MSDDPLVEEAKKWFGNCPEDQRRPTVSDELDRKLAARIIKQKLVKEYATDVVVQMCLESAYHGDVSIEDALVKCIQYLCEQNREYSKRLVEREWERPHIINMSDGTTRVFDPKAVRERGS